MAVPWRERPRDLAAGLRSSPRPRRWSLTPRCLCLSRSGSISDACDRRSPQGVRNPHVVNIGRRTAIVRLATRALKALRAPRFAPPALRAAGGLDRAIREPLGQLSTASREVLDDGRAAALLSNSSSPAAARNPLHIARCGARSNRRSQATVRSLLLNSLPGCLIRATSRPRNRRSERTALRPQARAQIRPVLQTSKSSRCHGDYACQTSMHRSRTQCAHSLQNEQRTGIDAQNGQAYHGRTDDDHERDAAGGNRARARAKDSGHQRRRRGRVASRVRSRAGAAGRARAASRLELKQRLRERFNEVPAVKVAIYARYSSDNQRDASIADQLRVCRAFAERQGWTIVRGVHRPRGVRRDAAALWLPGADARCAEPSIRRRPRRVAGPLQPRPGRHRRSLQAPHLRRRQHRHARRRRHHAPAHRIQGHDERPVPEGPGREDTPRTARSNRGRQVGRRSLLRLSRRQDAQRRNRHDRRTRNRTGRGRGRRAHLPRVRRWRVAEANREEPESRGRAGPFGGAWSPSTIYGNAKRGTGHPEQRAVRRPPGLESPALREES